MSYEKLIINIAKTAADNILLDIFHTNKGFPIKGWNYRLSDNAIRGIENISDKGLSEYALKHIEVINDLVKQAIEHKVKYLHAEGFTHIKRGNYVFYTEKEITKQLNTLIENDDYLS